MNNNELYEIVDYIGEVAAGDLVVYAKDGDFSKLGEYKKDIWKVEKLFLAKGEAFVNISNISKNGTDFKTYTNNVLAIDVLQDVDSSWQKYFSTRSLAALQKIKCKVIVEEEKTNYTTYDNDKEAWDALDRENDRLERKYNTQTGEVKMNMMNRVIDNNVGAAKAGAVVSAGNSLNKVVKNAVRNQVPRKYRKVIDSPVGDVLVANVASFAVQNFAKTNYKAKVAVDAMMTAAMVEVMNSFNLDTMITEVLSQVNLDEIIDTTGEG